ncbi:TlpA disulfide reductase family protein [Nonomuraea sp. NPDC050556]|uniref:TlpA disulfide reductase family protein n=1 Tax=Nonomuraea sp. NPDC050556 TaxID=3364369 RepID=UPI0037B6167B
MTYLTIFSTVLGLVNLLLVLAVLSRLRGQAQEVRERQIKMPVLPPGTTPEPFEATALDGSAVRTGDFRLVAFLSPACSLCHDRLPDLLAYAARSGQPLLAVLAGTREEVAELATEVGPSARVIVEEPEGPVWRAFGVRGLPAFYLLDGEGAVRGAGVEVSDLPAAEYV